MQKRSSEPRSRSRLSSLNWLPLAVLLLVILFMYTREPARQQLRYGQFKQILQAPGVAFRDVQVGPNAIVGGLVTRDRISGLPEEVRAAEPDSKLASRYHFVDGRHQRRVFWETDRVGLERDENLQTLLDTRLGSDYEAERAEGPFMTLLFYLFLTILMLGVMFVAFRFMVGGSGGPFSVGRSRHKVYVEKTGQVTFSDVAGIDEAKDELREVVDFLKKPEKYQLLGGRIPKGVLLVGPPGTGKTLLARAVAGEAEVPFFSISGSDFVELFAGVGASRVRDLFRDATSRAPCIIFIDELDALGRSRTGNAIASHEEREQTLNQLLVEMDGFDANRGVIIMAATNRPEILDQALLRPGRFDRTVVVDRPDVEGREAILQVHAKSVKFAEDVDLRRVAALTPGSVGADLANLVNEAALLAARHGKSEVNMSDFDEAIERGAVGLQRKSRIMRPEEKHRVAIHESGHALVACTVPNSDPVHKISIIPRGVGVGGYVLQRPESDRMLLTRSELEGNIKVLLGGTLAEELIFSEISTGASNDLMRANQIAQQMVTEFGMSRLGRIFHRDPEGLAFLGSRQANPSNASLSPESAREIDLEIRRIIQENLDTVQHLLASQRETLELVASKLMETEVLEGRELLHLLSERQFPLSESARRALLEPPYPGPSKNGTLVEHPAQTTPPLSE